MNVDPQWVIALSSILSAIGIIFVAYQAYCASKKLTLSNKIYNDYHDYERRKNAIYLTRDWSLFLSKEGNASKSFVDKLTKEQTELLYHEKEFEISKLLKDFLEKTIPELAAVEKDKNDKYSLSSTQSSIIKQKVVSYLNLLETILCARKHHVADSDLIKEEFSYLVVPSKGKAILPFFRELTGGINSYPAIERFVKEREKELTPQEEPSKPRLGNSV